MEKIGLFFGSDTGMTEEVAGMIEEELGKEQIDKYDVSFTGLKDMGQYDKLIIGLSTWHDGGLQSDWDDLLTELREIDFSGKKVAFFGLGDQIDYSEFFIDGVGVLAEIVQENGGKIVGKWSTEGYEHDSSLAEQEEGYFTGLAIDQDNQPDLTEERVQEWVNNLKEDFAISA